MILVVYLGHGSFHPVLCTAVLFFPIISSFGLRKALSSKSEELQGKEVVRTLYNPSTRLDVILTTSYLSQKEVYLNASNRSMRLSGGVLSSKSEKPQEKKVVHPLSSQHASFGRGVLCSKSKEPPEKRVVHAMLTTSHFSQKKVYLNNSNRSMRLLGEVS